MLQRARRFQGASLSSYDAFIIHEAVASRDLLDTSHDHLRPCYIHFEELRWYGDKDAYREI